jgi:hypothetical protein
LWFLLTSFVLFDLLILSSNRKFVLYKLNSSLFFFVLIVKAYHIDLTSGDYYSLFFLLLTMSIRYTKSSNSLQLDSQSTPITNMAKPSQADIEQMIQYARVRQ